MAARRVEAPDGTGWVVRRRWTPRYEGRGLRARIRAWRRRGRSDATGVADGADAAGCAGDLLLADSLSGIAIVIGVVALVIALLFLGVPLLLAIVDLVVVVAAVVGGALARLLLRRPWVVEATSDDGEHIVCHAVGWRRSGEVRDELATEISHGRGQVGSPP